jgi:esterase
MTGPLLLHYRDIDGAQPALLVLHGLFGSGSNWLSIGKHLARQRRTLLVDLRNHGQSPHSACMDYPVMVDDVLNLLDHLELPSVDLLGHSMGGKVAMLFALTHPERVRRLLVADIAPVTYPMDEHNRVLAALRNLDLSQTRTRQDAFERLSPAIPAAPIRQFLLGNLRPHANGGLHWRIPLALLQAALPRIGGFPDQGGKRFAGPTLFVRGERSPYVDDQRAAGIAAMFPAADLETLADAGHWLHADQPEVFTTLIEAYIGRCW